ncbi:MAG: hypothetical protein Fur003_5610 [Candidatus Dojkabacteria bacterium]
MKISKNRTSAPKAPKSKLTFKKLLRKAIPTYPTVVKSMRFLTLTLITIYFLVTLAVAAPKVEQIREVGERLGFDLVQKEYSKKTYVLELAIPNKDKKKAASIVADTKSIISRRLHRLGVEEFRIEEQKPKSPKVDSENVYRYLRIITQSTVSVADIDSVINPRGYLRIYTLRKDFNYEDQNNPLAAYLAENYDPTPFTRESFRTLYIKKLKTTDGSEAYFAVFKNWPIQNPSFKQFLEKNAGKKVGIAIDGIVNQVTIPYEFSDEYQSVSSNSGQTTTAKPVFTFGVAQDESSAKVADIVFNSGVIPVDFSTTDQKESEYKTEKVDEVQFMLIFAAWVVVIMAFTKLKKKASFQTLFVIIGTELFMLSTYLAYYKIGQFPIDLQMLILQSGLITLFLTEYSTQTGNKRALLVTVIGTLAIFALIGATPIQLFAIELLIMSALTIVANYIVNYYLNNMKLYLLNE